VRLADADDQATVVEDTAVGVAQRIPLRGLRGDRPRLAARLIDAVQAAVIEARAENDGSVAEPGTATVLVDARADVEARGDDVGGLAAVRAKDQRATSLLLRSALRPVDPLITDVEVAERDAAFTRDEIGRDRRNPGPVRGNGRQPAQRIELDTLEHEAPDVMAAAQS